MEVVNTQKTNKPDRVAVLDFDRAGDRLVVKGLYRTTVYQYGASGKNIRKVSFDSNGAAPFLFDRYDQSASPLALTGGCINENPLKRTSLRKRSLIPIGSYDFLICADHMQRGFNDDMRGFFQNKNQLL